MVVPQEWKVPENSPWLLSKFWPKDVPKQLDYDYDMTAYAMLSKTVEQYPDFDAIWFLETFVKYKEFKLYVDQFATSLAAMGFKKGDVLAIHLPNCIQYFVAYYGTLALGGIVTGVNPTYKSGEILHQLEICNAKYYVGLDALYDGYMLAL